MLQFFYTKSYSDRKVIMLRVEDSVFAPSMNKDLYDLCIAAFLLLFC